MHHTSWILSVLAAASAASAATLPVITPSPSLAPNTKNQRIDQQFATLVKRANNGQVPLAQSVWTSTLPNGALQLVTATTIDGVTISASPASKTDSAKATPWVSIDGSGVPVMVTPSIVSAGGETVSASPVPPTAVNGKRYPTPAAVPPVLRCFGDRVPPDRSQPQNARSAPGYPFCSPLNGTEWIVGETYWITWDPTYWGSSSANANNDDNSKSITHVRIFARSLPINDNEDKVFTTDWIPNADGYFPLTILNEYKIENTNGYMFINMAPLVPAGIGSDVDHVGTVSGPIIRVIRSKSEALHPITRVPSDNRRHQTGSSSSGLSKGQLVAAILLPIIVALVLAGFAYHWFVLRRRALSVKSVTAGKGNTIPRGQPLAKVTTGQSVGGQSQHTLSNPFHDAYGVELNERPTKPVSAI